MDAVCGEAAKSWCRDCLAESARRSTIRRELSKASNCPPISINSAHFVMSAAWLRGGQISIGIVVKKWSWCRCSIPAVCLQQGTVP